MKLALGLMFLQGHVATPAALAAVAPDLVDQVADAVQATRRAPPVPASPKFAEPCALAC
jgi:hypothetical protein